MPNALLSFKLGPVQPFIEAARTLRDLWSGSYLLSWLTAHGIKALHGQPGVKWITPDTVLEANPLLRAVIRGETGNPAATLACLPHTFAAEVPTAEAGELKAAVLKAVGDEWKRIAAAVHQELNPHFRKADPYWDQNWQSQIDSYFECTCVVLSQAEATATAMDPLGVPNDTSQDADNALWGRQWNLQKSLLDAARTVRHVPPYTPAARDHKYPMKCSLLGSYEQMGPADGRESQRFWETVSNGSGINGSRLRPNDKICAISLVKRFAWAVYWSDKLGLAPAELRYSDTPTMAAKKWLADGNALDPREYRSWNGQWLHWSNDDQGVADGDPKRPPELKATLGAKAKAQGCKPPTYYALLHLDGDNMGDVFQGIVGQQFGNGVARFREVTKRLTAFAQDDVKPIVETCQGEVIYAGGDDVLAFLPTETAVECAQQLQAAFGARLPTATLSGGIAVVHYAEDLRFALGQVRAAEKQAKRIGKNGGDPSVKDALAITVCRRSGERATAVMGWPETSRLQCLIRQFQAGASDRWAYKLREELGTLRHLPLEASRTETLRLMNRGEFADRQAFSEDVCELFDAYRDQMKKPERNWSDAEVLTGFVMLVQSASFLARGRE